MTEKMSRAKVLRRIEDPPSDEKIQSMAKCDTSSALTADFPEITMSDVGKLARAYLRNVPPSRLPAEPKAEGAEKAPEDKECQKCGKTMDIPYPLEATKYCNQCAHEVVDELESRNAELEEITKLLELRGRHFNDRAEKSEREISVLRENYDQWRSRAEDKRREVERLTQELSSTSAALERDRTSLCAPLKAIREAIKCREWLRLGRGSFEWDDDRWRDEFGFAIDEILAAIDPLAKIAADWSNCPKHTAEVEAARIDWQARALKAERELDDLKTANVDAKFREGYCESPAQAMVNSMPKPRVNDNFIQSRIYWGRAEGTGDVGIYEELQAWRAWAAGRVGK